MVCSSSIVTILLLFSGLCSLATRRYCLTILSINMCLPPSLAYHSAIYPQGMTPEYCLGGRLRSTQTFCTKFARIAFSTSFHDLLLVNSTSPTFGMHFQMSKTKSRLQRGFLKQSPNFKEDFYVGRNQFYFP